VPQRASLHIRVAAVVMDCGSAERAGGGGVLCGGRTVGGARINAVCGSRLARDGTSVPVSPPPGRSTSASPLVDGRNTHATQGVAIRRRP
jgi:hypothetical protein